MAFKIAHALPGTGQLIADKVWTRCSMEASVAGWLARSRLAIYLVRDSLNETIAEGCGGNVLAAVPSGMAGSD